MAEEKELNSVTGTQVEDMTPDYLAAIKELKQNSVDRSTYDALKAENKKLLDSVINGQLVEQVEAQVVPTEEDIQRIRNELFSQDNEMNNVQYVSKALELREALMLNGKADPFIPVGKQISPTNEDMEIAEKVATVYKECLEYAQGDNEAFTNELMRRTRDVRLPNKK